MLINKSCRMPTGTIYNMTIKETQTRFHMNHSMDED